MTMVRRHRGICRAVTTAATQTSSGTTGPQPATGIEQQVQTSGVAPPQGHQSTAIALQAPLTEEEQAPDSLDPDRTPKSLLLEVVQRLTRAPPPAAMFEVEQLTHKNGRMRFRARLRLPLLEQLPSLTEQEQRQAGDAGEDPREAKVELCGSQRPVWLGHRSWDRRDGSAPCQGLSEQGIAVNTAAFNV